MGTIRKIVERKDRTIHSVGPQATVREAVVSMCRNRIGALLVTEYGAPVGILSERDIMTRVVLELRNPSATIVEDVMTTEVVCIGADRDAEEAMALMTERRVRHLPVVEQGVIIGLISMGDLVRSASENQDSEIRMLQDYVGGQYP